MPINKEKNIPQHIGIIMDGNGRWAKTRGRPFIDGHRQGTKNAKIIVQECVHIGIKYLSLYVFSTENWKRAKEEIGLLMGLIVQHLISEMDFYIENKIRVFHSGNLEGLPNSVKEAIIETCNKTSGFDKLIVNLAINYGGRDEIVRAVKKLIASPINNEVSESSLSKHLDNSSIPEPDLIIRTGAEKRMSNFLLWQSAYSELFFSEKLWPDFTTIDLHIALENYAIRERRFGVRNE